MINAFHVLGAILALWAVLVGGLGITRRRFPAERRGERAVMVISMVLVAATIGAAIVTSASEDEPAGEQTSGAQGQSN